MSRFVDEDALLITEGLSVTIADYLGLTKAVVYKLVIGLNIVYFVNHG